MASCLSPPSLRKAPAHCACPQAAATPSLSGRSGCLRPPWGTPGTRGHTPEPGGPWLAKHPLLCHSLPLASWLAPSSPGRSPSTTYAPKWSRLWPFWSRYPGCVGDLVLGMGFAREGTAPRLPLQGLGAPLTSKVNQARSPLGPEAPQDWLQQGGSGPCRRPAPPARAHVAGCHHGSAERLHPPWEGSAAPPPPTDPVTDGSGGRRVGRSGRHPGDLSDTALPPSCRLLLSSLGPKPPREQEHGRATSVRPGG